MTSLTVPLSVRFHVVPQSHPVRHSEKSGKQAAPVRFRTPPVGERLLVMRMLGEHMGAYRPPAFLFRILAHRPDGSYGSAVPLRPAEPLEGVVLRARLRSQDLSIAHAWAQDHSLPVISVHRPHSCRPEFVHKILFLEAHRGGTTFCAHTPEVVLSSLAVTASPGRNGRRESLILTLCRGRHRGCPRVAVFPLSPPGVRIEFTKHDPQAAPVYGPFFPGRFFSVRSAVHALTDEDYSFREACRVFGVTPPAEPVSSSLIGRLDACVNELDALCELVQVTMRELLRHEAVVSDGNELERARERKLSVCAVQSPATLVKGYPRAAGIDTPPSLRVASDLQMTPDDIHGAAMGANFAGRAEVLLRHQPVPCAACDIRAQYPTVFHLQCLWSWLTAESVEAYDATEDARKLLATLTVEDLLRPETWARLPVACLMRPDRDFLPARIPCQDADPNRGDTGEREVVWGRVTVPSHCPPVWYTLGDLWISRQETGCSCSDRIIRAVGFRPVGQRPSLRSVLYGGVVPVDPVFQDLVHQMVEARAQLERDSLLHLAEGAKVQSNALAYGIWGELHRHTLVKGSRATVKCP